MMPKLRKLRDIDLTPVRADRVPSVRRATREAIAHIGGAPVPERWDVDRPRVVS